MTAEQIISYLQSHSEYYTVFNIVNYMFRGIGWGITMLINKVSNWVSDLFDAAFKIINITYSYEFEALMGDFYGGFRALLYITLIAVAVAYLVGKKRPPLLRNIVISLAVVTLINPLTLTTINLLNTYKEGADLKDPTDCIIASNITDIVYLKNNSGEPASDGRSNYFADGEDAFAAFSINDVINEDYFDKQKDFACDWYWQYGLRMNPKTNTIEAYEFPQKTIHIIEKAGYYRYSVNWFMMYAEMIFSIIVLFLMAYKMFRLMYDFIFGEILTLVAAGDIFSGQYLKKALTKLLETFLGICALILSYKIYTMIMAWGNYYLTGYSKLIKLIIDFFAGLAAIDGPNIVAGVIGIDIGAKDTGALIRTLSAVNRGIHNAANNSMAGRTANAAKNQVANQAADKILSHMPGGKGKGGQSEPLSPDVDSTIGSQGQIPENSDSGGGGSSGGPGSNSGPENGGGRPDSGDRPGGPGQGGGSPQNGGRHDGGRSDNGEKPVPDFSKKDTGTGTSSESGKKGLFPEDDILASNSDGTPSASDIPGAFKGNWEPGSSGSTPPTSKDIAGTGNVNSRPDDSRNGTSASFPSSPTSRSDSSKTNPSSPTSGTDFSEIQPPESASGSDFSEIQPPESASGSDFSEVQPSESTSGTDFSEIQPPESASGSDFSEVQPPEAASGSYFSEIQPPESASGLDSSDVQPPEPASVKNPTGGAASPASDKGSAVTPTPASTEQKAVPRSASSGSGTKGTSVPGSRTSESRMNKRIPTPGSKAPVGAKGQARHSVPGSAKHEKENPQRTASPAKPSQSVPKAAPKTTNAGKSGVESISKDAERKALSGDPNEAFLNSFRDRNNT